MADSAFVHLPSTRFDTAYGVGSFPISAGLTVAHDGIGQVDADIALFKKFVLEELNNFVLLLYDAVATRKVLLLARWVNIVNYDIMIGMTVVENEIFGRLERLL
jgi:hypothetical protein